LLEAEHGIRVDGRLVRRFVEYADGGSDEVNILGEGRRGQTPISIVGEAKAPLGRRDVDRFLKRVGRLDRHAPLRSERFLLVVSHSVRPDVERYARAKGLTVPPSYLSRAEPPDGRRKRRQASGLCSSPNRPSEFGPTRRRCPDGHRRRTVTPRSSPCPGSSRTPAT
jgi:hypothetical protein